MNPYESTLKSFLIGLVLSVTCPVVVFAADFTTVLNIPPDPNITDNQSVGSDTQVNLGDGGSIGHDFNFSYFSNNPEEPVFPTNVEVNITGGTVGYDFYANSGIAVNISGGTVDSLVTHNSTVNVSGGTIDGNFTSNFGSVVNFSGGTIGDFFNVTGGSTVNMSGGTVGDYFNVGGSSVVNISGGDMNAMIHILNGELNLFGSEFSIDGVPITGLLVNQQMLVTDRDATLTGILEDGSAFSLDLPAIPEQGKDRISDNSTLTVTLSVPEPTGAVLVVLMAAFALPRTRS